MSEPYGQVTGVWSLLSTEVSKSLSELTLPYMAPSTALDEGIPITDPTFYSSEIRCPDSVIAHVFRPAAHCSEPIPLLHERIAILRQNGKILCKVGGSDDPPPDLKFLFDFRTMVGVFLPLYKNSRSASHTVVLRWISSCR